MTILSGNNIGELPVKRPYGYGGTEGSYFPANFKHPKVNAAREFPKSCQFATGASKVLPRKPSCPRFKVRKAQVERKFPKACGAHVLPPQLKKIVYGEAKVLVPEVPAVDSIQQVATECGKLSPLVSTLPSKVVSGEDSVQTLIVQGEGACSPEKTSGGLGMGIYEAVLVNLGLSSDSVNANDAAAKVSDDGNMVSERIDETKMVNASSCDSAASIDGASKVSDDRNVVSERFDETKMVNGHHEPIHATGSSRRALASTCPPLKICKGFSAFRQFSPHIVGSDSELEDQVGGSDREEMDDEVKCTPVIGEGKCTEGEDIVLPPVPYVEVVDDIIDGHSVYPSNITLSPDSAPQAVSAENMSTMVGKSMGAEEGSHTSMSSHGAESDTQADRSDAGSTMLKRKWLSDGEPVEGTCESLEARDVARSDFISLQKRHVTEASKRKDVKEDSFIEISEDEGADNRYDINRLGDDEKKLDEHICSHGASYGLSISPCDDNTVAYARQKVRETLNLFKENFAKLSEEDVPRLRERKKPVRTAYLAAAMNLKKQQKWVNSERLIGPVPGIEIGDKFRYRAELVVVGLHHQFQAGIDYMMKDGVNYATSIVDSSRYANAAESSDVLVYSGVGGNPSLASKNKPDDQKLERGNLALKNSMDKHMPVRVIRGRQNAKALNSKENYTYDGLYHVTSCKQEIGKYGKLVFMFQLNRLPGQPKLVWETSSQSENSKPCVVKPVVDDISNGRERIPIPVINTLDGEKPPHFYYLTKILHIGKDKYSMLIGCDCEDGCSDTEPCLCTSRNGGEIPFNDYGAIVVDEPLVYECGPSCKCPPSCKNRVSQKGIQYQLEIFKTKTHGWGVRSQSYIPLGSFICEYVGELLGEKQAERRQNDEYLFDVGCDRENVEDSGGDAYTIDAAYCGNVGRFFNHSCSPNMYAQNVLYDHSEKRFPHVMFFAGEDIPPLQELTYDYNYKQVLDGDGNIKKKECFCGSSECVGRMY